MALFKNNEIDLTENNGDRPNFFSIKADREVKFVRFLYKSMDDITWAVVHEKIVIGGYERRVNCLKPNNCPMCDAGVLTAKKAYLEMICYEVVNGQFTGKKEYCIWERGPKFIRELQSNVNRYVGYGKNLFDYVWEIERENGRTIRDVTYRVRKAEDTVAQYCPISQEDFPQKPYDPIESKLVVSKTAAEMKTYLEVGEFPDMNNNQVMQQQGYQNMGMPQYQPRPQPQPQQYQPNAQFQGFAPQPQYQPQPMQMQQPVQQGFVNATQYVPPVNASLASMGQVDDVETPFDNSVPRRR